MRRLGSLFDVFHRQPHRRPTPCLVVLHRPVECPAFTRAEAHFDGQQPDLCKSDRRLLSWGASGPVRYGRS